MPTNTKYDPQHINEYEKTKLNKSAIGISATCTAGTTTNIDLDLTEDFLMVGGGACLVHNSAQGDYMDFQVLAPNGQGGFVLANQFVSTWYVDWTNVNQPVPKAIYPAKIFAGLKLRVVYHSVGNSNPIVYMNYDLEKVLM